ncbi:carboxylate-amine ligase [Kitasatospora kifunensis]|uniref:Putative glutamate--cysteine ligase 2 n=1 Tax=Kitasatospora kifunensis TaxID=58351 RepID=A0A7W7QX18_KITKI|nr:glutamate--cysteine ligase [Kitasatospora kifunensis]MBB4921098.1 carboxylate-amine ligase [Kitasatospora kifunensis]
MAVSMGVEEEFHIVDVESRMLVARAHEVLDVLPGRGFATEFQQSVVESNSGVHASLDALHADLARSRRTLAGAAAPLGLAVVAAGTVPLARPGSVDATPHPRYARMVDEYRMVADEQLICGAQVHVDVPDRDTAVRAMCAISPWLPTLLALSASSPFWLGADTGYASWRTLLWQRWPTTGPVGCFGSAVGYDAAVAALVRSGVISDAGMVYYDIRPSAHQRTLELRICDACPRVETVVMIAGLFRALVVDACEAVRGSHHCQGSRQPWLRAATWRAARSGLDGALVDPTTGLATPARVVVRSLLTRLRPTLERFGDWANVCALAEQSLARGDAAQQLRSVAESDGLAAVVDLLAGQTRAGTSPRARIGTRIQPAPERHSRAARVAARRSNAARGRAIRTTTSDERTGGASSCAG